MAVLYSILTGSGKSSKKNSRDGQLFLKKGKKPLSVKTIHPTFAAPNSSL